MIWLKRMRTIGLVGLFLVPVLLRQLQSEASRSPFFVIELDTGETG